MDQSELLRKVLSALEASGVEYILVGSVASAAYGEPRLTLDIDVAAALTPGNLPRFPSSFPDPEYYSSREAASEAIKRKGLKQSLSIFRDRPAFFASPEDVIIRKMEYFGDRSCRKRMSRSSMPTRCSGHREDFREMPSD